jgi:hypothetical protein
MPNPRPTYFDMGAAIADAIDAARDFEATMRRIARDAEAELAVRGIERDTSIPVLDQLAAIEEAES